jgi:hypothetical protein
MKGACLGWMLFANKQEQESDMDSLPSHSMPTFQIFGMGNKI